MKLNTVIFCLCAGACSSAMIDNAFSMNAHRRLDSYNVLVVGKYLKTKQDLVNLALVKKDFRATIDKYRLNHVPISPNNIGFWEQIETLHIYSRDELKNWGKSTKEFLRDVHNGRQSKSALKHFFRVEVDFPMRLKEAQKQFRHLKKLLTDSPKEYGGYVIFNHIYPERGDNIGHANGDKFIFANGIQFGQNNIRASNGMFQVNANYDKNDKIKPVYLIRDIQTVDKTVQSIDIPFGVKSIDHRAFSECFNLESITIPTSVTSIGSFNKCARLTSITIPDTAISIGSFERCTQLTSIAIPDTATSVGSFEGCTKLTSIKLPTSIKSIVWGMFKGCIGLTSITIPNNVTSISWNAFEGCSRLTSINIPDSLISIDEYAFSGCIGLTSIILPGSINSINKTAFYGCHNATFIVPLNGMKKYLCSTRNIAEDKIKVIETPNSNNYAWAWPEDGNIEIPDNITVIDSYRFTNRNDIKSVKISNSVQSIRYEAFAECTNLTSIIIPDSVTSIENNAFINCSSLKSIIIPSSVTSINHYTFKGCKNLTSVTIHNGVRLIEEYAFYMCPELTSITIPDSVMSIEKCAFTECVKLSSITIPKFVTNLQNDTFRTCQNLKLINIRCPYDLISEESVMRLSKTLKRKVIASAL